MKTIYFFLAFLVVIVSLVFTPSTKTAQAVTGAVVYENINPVVSETFGVQGGFSLETSAVLRILPARLLVLC